MTGSNEFWDALDGGDWLGAAVIAATEQTMDTDQKIAVALVAIADKLDDLVRLVAEQT